MQQQENIKSCNSQIILSYDQDGGKIVPIVNRSTQKNRRCRAVWVRMVPACIRPSHHWQCCPHVCCESTTLQLWSKTCTNKKTILPIWNGCLKKKAFLGNQNSTGRLQNWFLSGALKFTTYMRSSRIANYHNNKNRLQKLLFLPITQPSTWYRNWQ